jgi:hypothetical protein
MMTGEEGFHEKGTSAYCKEGFFPNLCLGVKIKFSFSQRLLADRRKI